MRQLLLCSVVILVPVVALTQAGSPSVPAKGSTPAPVASAAPEVERHNLVATVVSVDAAKSTITFKDAKGQSQTWKAEGKAAARLKNLKAGSKVKISYSVDDKGAPKAAISIRFVGKGKTAEAT